MAGYTYSYVELLHGFEFNVLVAHGKKKKSKAIPVTGREGP
jgi:hypothetical protein